MKKLIATLVMLALILSIACPMSLAEGEKVHLSLAYHNVEPATLMLPDGTTKPQMYEAIIARFEEANPDIEIEYIPLPVDASEELSKINMMAASDSLPDMFNITYVVAHDWYEAGIIADLTPYISQELQDHLFGISFDQIKANTDPDKIYWFPTQIEAQGWFYNKALFDQCGLEIPETWDDFINCVKVFKENDILPIAHGAADMWDVWGYYPIWWRNGYAEEVPALVSGEMKFSESKAMRTSFEYIQQLAELGAYPENATTMSNTAAMETFLGGGAAMYTGGSWMQADFDASGMMDNIVFSWGPIFPDSASDQKVGMKVTGWGMYVNAKDEGDEVKMQAIKRFFEFLGSEETALFQRNEYNHFPSTVLEDTSSMSAFTQMIYAAFDDEYTGCEEVYMPFPSSFTDVFWNGITAIITGYATVDEVLQQFDDWAALQ